MNEIGVEPGLQRHAHPLDRQIGRGRPDRILRRLERGESVTAITEPYLECGWTGSTPGYAYSVNVAVYILNPNNQAIAQDNAINVFSATATAAAQLDSSSPSGLYRCVVDATATGLEPTLSRHDEATFEYQPQGPPLPQCVPIIDQMPVGFFGTFQQDGKWHYTYDTHGATGNILAAMEKAITDWNAWSAFTRVVFEPAAGGAVQFNAVGTPPAGPVCAAYSVGTSRIDWEPGLAGVAASDMEGAAAVFKHELGHFLGLNEAGANPNPMTIMGNPTMGDTCQNAVNTAPTRLIWQNDAQAANHCAMLARQAHQ